MTEPNNESPLVDVDTALKQSAVQSLSELDEAVQLINADQEVEQPLSEEERSARDAARTKMLVERARRQRNRGREEMDRVYAGVLVVDQKLEVFDPHLASSVVRFLALTDKTLHLLARVGAQYMNDTQVAQLSEEIQSKIGEYARQAQQVFTAAEELRKKRCEENLMWLEPHYSKAMLSTIFAVKSRHILVLADAVSKWDEAIRLMSEMEFNGFMSHSQVSTLRLTERRLFSDINRFCISVVTGMSRRSMDDATNSEKGVAVA